MVARPSTRRLPQVAEEYIDSLRVTLKPSTCGNYRQSLFMLHNWLDAHGHSTRTLTRAQTSRWLRYLVERGQGPASRVRVINPVRAYLRALEDAGLLDTAADELLRDSDLPKLPTYLPRPLSPAVDRELQRRLAASSAPYQRGLLAMRNTGLRIGELTSLPLDCIREDELGNAFLKVPLGKMNNERLVPLDARTRLLVTELQRGGRRGRKLLLESPRGNRPGTTQMQKALDLATAGIDGGDRVTTHRLRHTYATTLLNAGMSLMGIMKLLGHRDYRMTLRYAAITLETVGKEYRAAVTQLENRYSIGSTLPALPQLEADGMLTDVIRWVQKRTPRDADNRRRTLALVKRLKRLREELTDL